MIVNCFKEVFSQYHLVVSKKTICCGKRVFQNIIWNTYMWELFLSQKCVRSPCKLTISSTSTALKDLSFFCKPIGRVENPEENERGLVVMKQHLAISLICLTTPSLLVKDFHIAWPDEKKGDARWKTSPCKFTAASSVPPTGQSTTLPAFMAHRWKVNCNTLKGIWAD